MTPNKSCANPELERALTRMRSRELRKKKMNKTTQKSCANLCPLCKKNYNKIKCHEGICFQGNKIFGFKEETTPSKDNTENPGKIKVTQNKEEFDTYEKPKKEPENTYEEND